MEFSQGVWKGVVKRNFVGNTNAHNIANEPFFDNLNGFSRYSQIILLNQLKLPVHLFARCMSHFFCFLL